MALGILIAIYLIMAGCEIAFPQKCVNLAEKIIESTNRIRLLSIFAFFMAFLYYMAEPTTLQWFITILFWIYVLSGIWAIAHPKSVMSLCRKSFKDLSYPEKRFFIYLDCAFRTILALILIYTI